MSLIDTDRALPEYQASARREAAPRCQDCGHVAHTGQCKGRATCDGPECKGRSYRCACESTEAVTPPPSPVG